MDGWAAWRIPQYFQDFICPVDAVAPSAGNSAQQASLRESIFYT
jgi:hypothetical protein